MAYWIYQHLGNLSPSELAEDDIYGKLRDGGDGSAAVRDLAEHAEFEHGHSRFSFCSDLGPARLVVVDSRAGRVLEEGKRRIVGEEEWEWVKDKADADRSHLILASSLPFLLPYGMHDLEAWSEAIGEGAWGKRSKPLGEKVRIASNLDHWAAFQRSYREFEQLVIDIASGQCGEPPETLVMFGGDVHHCFVSKVEPAEHRGHRLLEGLARGLLGPSQGARSSTSGRCSASATPGSPRRWRGCWPPRRAGPPAAS